VDAPEASVVDGFASKAQMFEGLIEFIEQTLFALINKITGEEKSGVRQLEAIIGIMLAFAQKNRGMTRVLVGDALVNEDERLQTRINQLHDRLEAALKQAEAALATAEIARGDTVIRAAADGIVGNRTVQVGQLVKPGSQLMVLVPLPEVHIVANFKETQLKRMRPGQKVTLEVDAFPGRPIEGTVESFAPASGSQFSLLPPENASGNFTKIVQRLPVRISLPRDNALAGLIRPGLSVVASVDTRDTVVEAPLLGSLMGSALAANK